jgi:hypothetical protein
MRTKIDQSVDCDIPEFDLLAATHSRLLYRCFIVSTGTVLYLYLACRIKGERFHWSVLFNIVMASQIGCCLVIHIQNSEAN